jgi:hypothetical protein
MYKKTMLNNRAVFSEKDSDRKRLRRLEVRLARADQLLPACHRILSIAHVKHGALPGLP